MELGVNPWPKNGDEKMKTGLVLEGGAMRGMYTAGVIDVMLENNIRVNGIIGVSAGAVFGCNYKSGQIGRVIRYNTKFCKDPRYMSLRSLIKTGDLFGEQFCYHDIPEILDPFDTEEFRNNPAEFYVVCTDVRTGKPVYHLCEKGDGEDVQWMRASASMPLVSRIVSVSGKDMLDGGISDPIPILKFREMGYEKCIVVLTRPQGYRKKQSPLIPVFRIAMKKYPETVKALEKRHEVYNTALESIETLQQQGDVFVLRPSEAFKMRRTENNPERLRALYKLGRKDAMSRLYEIRSFLHT